METQIEETPTREVPEFVIPEILCLLPIKDAVRTCILARSWRHHWKSMLKLDVTSIPDVIVSRILTLHSGYVYSFKARSDDYNTIYSWLETLSLNSASTLNILELSSNNDGDEEVTFNSIAQYLPCITYLKLSTFRLNCVQSVLDKDFPILRTLVLHNCKIRGELSTAIFPALDSLDFDAFLQLSSDEVPTLRIDSKSLKHLSVYDPVYMMFKDNPSDSSYIRAPALESARLACCVRGFKLEKLLGGMPNITSLSMANNLLQTLAMDHPPKRIPLRLNCLRSVSLCGDFGLVKSALVALCLLRSIPNMQKLCIDVCTEYYLASVVEVIEPGFWDAQDYLGIFDRLERLEMLHCLESMIEFLKIILAKAQELKDVEISFSETVGSKELAKEAILDFPKISCLAQIRFS